MHNSCAFAMLMVHCCIEDIKNDPKVILSRFEHCYVKSDYVKSGYVKSDYVKSFYLNSSDFNSVSCKSLFKNAYHHLK